jgi:hypothetical protein
MATILTQSGSGVLGMILEVVASPGAFVMEFNVDNVVRVLVGDVNDANHVEGCGGPLVSWACCE